MATLNWLSGFGASGTAVTDGASTTVGTTTVTLGITNNGAGSYIETRSNAQYEEAGEPYLDNNSLILVGAGGGGATGTYDFNMGFGRPVEDVTFRINDLDTSSWDDQITISATDANGNQIVVFATKPAANTGTLTGSGTNTVTFDAAGGNGSAASASGSIEITIPGPVSNVLLEWGNLGTGGQAIWLSSVEFNETTPDGTVSGTSGDDTIDLAYIDINDGEMVDNGDGTLGTTGDQDVIDAGAGDDSVLGGNAEDTIYGGIGNDEIDGGGGADVIDSTDGTGAGVPDGIAGENPSDDLDTVYGGGGADSIFTGDDADIVYGGSGADSIDSGIDDDTVFGGTGDDNITAGAGDDEVTGGAGSDVISGEGGDDIINAGDSAAPAPDATDANPSDDLDTVYGGAGDDTITSGDDRDTLYGGDGADSIDGGIDDDDITGGSGDDNIQGGDGDDVIRGDLGPDAVMSGTGKMTYEFFELDGQAPSNLAAAGFVGADNTSTPDATGTTDTLDVNAIDAAHGGDGETFAVKYTTTLDVTTAGTYDFSTTSDDGSQLYINGELVVNNDGLHGPVTQNGSIDLGAGTHTIEIIYFENTGGDSLAATVSGPDTGSVATPIADAVAVHSYDDTLDGGAGEDEIYGDIGTDTITGGDGNDTLYGGGDDDTITVGAGDTAYGGDGDDIFILDLDQAGNTTVDIYGGEGDEGNTNDATNPVGDRLDLSGYGVTRDQVVFSNEDDALGGVSGTATFDYLGQTYTVNFDAIEQLILASDGTVSGTDNDDVIDGSYDDPYDGDEVDAGDFTGPTGDEDIIDGKGGDDTIFAGDENDTVYGGTGNDSIDGGAGNDTIDSTDGSGPGVPDGTPGEDPSDDIDTVEGGSGDDSIFTGDDTDTIYGGTGNDTIDAGIDDDTVFGGSGNDSIVGGDGEDSIQGGTGNDVIDGGADNDIIDSTDGSGAGVPDGTPGEDPADDIDIVYGGSGADSIFTGDDADTVYGGSGTDTIDGGIDDDDLRGGGDDDVITGGDGNDVIRGDAGDDTINAGESLNPLPDATDPDPSDDLDTVYGGTGNDIITTGDDADTVYGGADNDSIDGGIDNDYLEGGTGDDTIEGGDGSDSIIGGAGTDTMYGGGDDDDIIAGASDAAYGGGGDDVFTIDPASGDTGGITIVGGETDEGGADTTNGGAGDVLDLRGLTNASGEPLAIADILYSGGNNEAGTVTLQDGTLITFSEIETILTDQDGTVSGTAGADVINAGYTGDPDGDRVDANDAVGIMGEAPLSDDDLIIAGAGDDSIDAGDGNDVVYAGTGADTIEGRGGENTLYGGDDADLFHIGVGNDTVVGGEGGNDQDVMSIVDVDDTITVTFTDGEEGVYADDDGDSGAFSEIEELVLSAGNDSVDGTASDASMTVSGEDGNDDITGGSADDTLYGGDGSDSLVGGDGTDALYGGGDDDDIEAGASDIAYGGAGDDVFTVDPTTADTGDITIVGGETDEGGADTTNGGGGDTLDLSALYASGDIEVGSLNFDPGNPETGSVRLTDGTTINFSEIENFICFTRGTLIRTEDGEKPIEELMLGDKIVTRDHGLQELKWVGSRAMPAVGKMAPVVIKKGALGNTQELKVSPQHRMLVEGWKAEMLFGESEVLVAAKHLVNGDTIYMANGGTVEYFHILFDSHEIVYANGAPSESFHPGEEGWDALTEDAREEVLTIFPELRGNVESYGPAVRTSLKSFEAKILGENPEFLS